MRHLKRFFWTTGFFIAFIASVSAAEPINTLERSGLWGYEPSGISVRGYDTVAYFTLGKPVKGKEAFETEWKGAKWRFSSQQHLDLFVVNPDKYAPQYGGYCAYGVAVGNLVKIEADLWDIIDGKLYLNYDEKLQGNWREDIAGYIVQANGKFDRLLIEK
ncbi:MAG: YHS domain-containing protein [Gammaproteobacteria bacterium]|jgi:YHS domain-containing protein